VPDPPQTGQPTYVLQPTVPVANKPITVIRPSLRCSAMVEGLGSVASRKMAGVSNRPNFPPISPTIHGRQEGGQRLERKGPKIKIGGRGQPTTGGLADGLRAARFFFSAARVKPHCQHECLFRNHGVIPTGGMGHAAPVGHSARILHIIKVTQPSSKKHTQGTLGSKRRT